MGPITILWIAVIIFSGLIFWGINVPTGKRTPAIYWIVGTLIVFQLLTQSFLFRIDASAPATSTARRTAAEAIVKFEKFLEQTAIAPGKLHYYAPAAWYRVITSSFLHYGWIHFIFNVWFLALFGHVIEHVFGAKKLLAIVAAGLIIPPALDGFFPLVTSTDVHYTGGLSGVVYAVMGAFLVCFPHSRAYGAINYDLKFWAALLFFLLPVTMVTRFAGVALTETVMIMGVVAAFLLIQPEHARISAPVILVMLYKLVQDTLILEPSIRDIFSNSAWRIGGGFFIGMGAGLAINGLRGWSVRWGDETRTGSPVKYGSSRARVSVARLEIEGRKSAEGAKVYLGQRVFVGDAERAVAFYRDVVIPTFPDVLLPMQEQMALARMLHFKGYDVEALHAYETLLHYEPLPDEYAIARLKAAELLIKLAPGKSQRARELLDRFERGHVTMMRDRVEAQRLRAMLPVVEKPYTSDRQDQPAATVPAYSAEPSDMAPPVTSSRRSRKEATEAAASAETPAFTPIRPRTFVYVSGASPVRLQQAPPGDNADTPEKLSDDELLRRHWKPLPCMAEKKPLSTSVLERRVTNSRVIEDDDKPTMYSAGKGDKRTEAKPGGRLSQLELVKLNPAMPATTEMPGQYGALDTSSAGGAVDPFSRLKLRRENEKPSSSSLQSRRARRNKETTTSTRDNWGPRLVKPENIPADTQPEEQLYGEASPASESPEATYAALLTSPDQIDLSREFKALHTALAEKYAATDYSEICQSGFAPLFLYRGVTETDKPVLQDAANAAGLNIRLIPETDPLLQMEPVEVNALVLAADGCTLKTAYGSRRLAWEEVSLLSLCDIRLTPNSRSLHRLILELVILSGKTPQRFQVFERTVMLTGSSINGKMSTDTRQMLEAAWAFAKPESRHAKIYPEEITKDYGPAGYPVFESYALYNEEILRHLFAKQSE